MNKRIMRVPAWCLGALLLLPFAVEARDGKITIAGAISDTNLSIDPEYRISAVDIDFDAAAISTAVGYQFSNGFLVEAGYMSYSTADFFNFGDSYDLHDWQVCMGYAYALQSWRFVGKAGYAFWELEAEEGMFLNPGAEERRETDGSDPVWTLAIEKFFSRIFAMSLSYQRSDRDFGYVESFGLGIKFAF